MYKKIIMILLLISTGSLFGSLQIKFPEKKSQSNKRLQYEKMAKKLLQVYKDEDLFLRKETMDANIVTLKEEHSRLFGKLQQTMNCQVRLGHAISAYKEKIRQCSKEKVAQDNRINILYDLTLLNDQITDLWKDHFKTCMDILNEQPQQKVFREVKRLYGQIKLLQELTHESECTLIGFLKRFESLENKNKLEVIYHEENDGDCVQD